MTKRAWNIALRTAHVGAMGVLLGGHAFDVEPERLRLAFALTLGTGLALAAVESELRLRWLHEGCGLLVVAKLLLLGAVPLVWAHRLPLLLGVVVLGSVGSHMPARYRHYSVWERRVLTRTDADAGGSRES